MKIADIKADGTVYWFDRGSDWGNFISSDYSRYPCVRVDEKRYAVRETFSGRGHQRESVTGRYVLVQEVNEGGRPTGRTPRAVLASQVRATYAEVKTRYEQTQEHGRQLAAARARRLAELKLRLSRAGVPSTLIGVEVSSSFRDSEPTISVEFLPSPDQAGALEKLLDLIEGAR